MEAKVRGSGFTRFGVRSTTLSLALCTVTLALLIACGREQGPSVSLPPQPSPQALAAKTPDLPAATPAAQAGPTSATPEVKPALSKAEGLVYRYDPRGRHDPFQPLINTSMKAQKAKSKGPGGVTVNELKLSGIIWGELKSYYALVEAPNGLGYTIKTGDTFGDGTRVVRITKESVLFEVKGDELRQQKTLMVELKLMKEE